MRLLMPFFIAAGILVQVPARAAEFAQNYVSTACGAQSGTRACWGQSAPYGNNIQDGQAFGAVLAKVGTGSANVNCGDTIVLTANTDYGNWYLNGSSQNAVQAFSMPAQSGCSSGQYTQFVSSAIASLPAGQQVIPVWPNRMTAAQKQAVYALMPHMLAVCQPSLDANHCGAYPFITLGGNNWAWRGVAFSADPGFKANNHVVSPVVDGGAPSYYPPASCCGSNFEFDRCYIVAPEEVQYGGLEDYYDPTRNAQTDLNTWETHFRTTGIGLHFEQDNVWIHDSAISTYGGEAGVSGDFHLDSCTNAKPAVCHSSDISTVRWPCGSGTCTWGSGFIGLAVVKGATGTGWTGVGGMNGIKYFGYIDSTHAFVLEGWFLESPTATANKPPLDATAWDSSGGGSGMVARTFQPTGSSNSSGLLSETGSQNVRIENNTIDSWAWNIFIGGGGAQSNNGGTLQSGSTWNSIVVALNSGAAPPSIGDWVAFDSSGSPPSPACIARGNHGAGCWDGKERVGQVTGVSGTGPYTISITGTNGGWAAADPTGIPNVGGIARWDGRPSKYWKITGNVLYRTYAAFGGKSALEVKNCDSCLVAGNYFLKSVTALPFLHSNDQGAYAPWQTTNNFEFSYNLAGTIYGGPAEMLSQCLDSEGFDTTPTVMNRWLHNLFPQTFYRDPTISGAGPEFAMSAYGCGTTSGAGSIWSHNTVLPADPSVVALSGLTYGAAHYLYSDGDICAVTGIGNYGKSNAWITDNILDYGNGVYQPASPGCWQNYASGPGQGIILRNVLWDQLGVGTSAINSLYPGNSLISQSAGKAAIGFTGTCTPVNPLNCALSNSSSYKGAARDGSDPGADAVAVVDRVNQWSERAGIISWATAQAAMVNNPSAWTSSNTTTALRLSSLDPNPSTNCSFHVYTDLARTTEHPDTAGSGNSACNRAGNTVNGTNVTLVFGGHAALTPGTTYSYTIGNGSDSRCITDLSGVCGRTMVGTFTTSGTPPTASPLFTGIRISGGKAQ